MAELIIKSTMQYYEPKHRPPYVHDLELLVNLLFQTPSFRGFKLTPQESESFNSVTHCAKTLAIPISCKELKTHIEVIDGVLERIVDVLKKELSKNSNTSK
jgi:hypothetical protein